MGVGAAVLDHWIETAHTRGSATDIALIHVELREDKVAATLVLGGGTDVTELGGVDGHGLDANLGVLLLSAGVDEMNEAVALHIRTDSEVRSVCGGGDTNANGGVGAPVRRVGLRCRERASECKE